jgi:hypothetical protein
MEDGDDVQQAVVAGCAEVVLGGQLRVRQEAERSQAVVERHHDDPARGERGAVVDVLRAVAVPVAAAVDPHQYRRTA